VGVKSAQYPFRHGARHMLPSGLALFDSYHCSRYNTQTRRLTAAMFEAVFADISTYLQRVRS
jgi:uracil-DNA glycosylase